MGAPTNDVMKNQMELVRAYSGLRSERLGEIGAQVSSIAPFFATLGRFERSDKKSTNLFMAWVSGMVSRMVLAIKFGVSYPRPVELNQHVMPIIPTPSHSSFPSGHATAAFALATVQQHLLTSASIDETELSKQLDSLAFRLAARIAENRVVAGVHFPVDNAAGAILGFKIAQALVVAAKGGGKVKALTFNAPDWLKETDHIGDFVLETFSKALSNMAISDMSTTWKPLTAASETVTIAKAPDIIRDLYDAAVTEHQ